MVPAPVTATLGLALIMVSEPSAPPALVRINGSAVVPIPAKFRLG